jgi:hypothetical protein
MSPLRLVVPLVVAAALLAGCGSKQAPTSGGPTADQTVPATTAAVTPGSTPAATNGGGSGGGGDWPSPEDCVSYNPTSLTTHYEAGIWTVGDGSVEAARVEGGPSDNKGQKLLALAQHYKRHCYLGRGRMYEDTNNQVFDYWRDPTGQTAAIPDQDTDCSAYDPTNLTVEDMGGNEGWRVKDHDHILQLFFTEQDARAGQLVLSKYTKVCLIGDISYSL